MRSMSQRRIARANPPLPPARSSPRTTRTAAQPNAQRLPSPKPAAVAMRWTRSLEESMTEWLCRRDKNGMCKNFNTYIARKTETAGRILTDLELLKEEPTLTAKKLADKLNKMLDKYKDVVKELGKSGGGTGDMSELGAKLWGGAGGKAGETIKAYIDRTCHWYWSFDEVLGTRTNIRPPMVASSAGLPSSTGPSRHPAPAQEDVDDPGLEGPDDDGLAQRLLDEEVPMSDLSDEDEEERTPDDSANEAVEGEGVMEGRDDEDQPNSGTNANPAGSSTNTASSSKAKKTPATPLAKGTGPVLVRRQLPVASPTPAKKGPPSMVDAMVGIEARRQTLSRDRERAAAQEAAKVRKATEAAEKEKWSGDHSLKYAELEAARREKEAEREERRQDKKELEDRREREAALDRARRDEQWELERASREELREEKKEERRQREAQWRMEMEDRAREREERTRREEAERSLERERLRLEMKKAEQQHQQTPASQQHYGEYGQPFPPIASMQPPYLPNVSPPNPYGNASFYGQPFGPTLFGNPQRPGPSTTPHVPGAAQGLQREVQGVMTETGHAVSLPYPHQQGAYPWPGFGYGYRSQAPQDGTPAAEASEKEDHAQQSK